MRCAYVVSGLSKSRLCRFLFVMLLHSDLDVSAESQFFELRRELLVSEIRADDETRESIGSSSHAGDFADTLERFVKSPRITHETLKKTVIISFFQGKEEDDLCLPSSFQRARHLGSPPFGSFMKNTIGPLGLSRHQKPSKITLRTRIRHPLSVRLPRSESENC